jgi:hypothetical protein
MTGMIHSLMPSKSVHWFMVCSEAPIFYSATDKHRQRKGKYNLEFKLQLVFARKCSVKAEL